MSHAGDVRPRATRVGRLERRRVSRRNRLVLLLGVLVAAAGLAVVDVTGGGLPVPERPDAGSRKGAALATGPATPPASTGPAASPSLSPTLAAKIRVPVPYRGPGTFATASGSSPVAGRGGTLLRYRVRVEKGTGQDPEAFAWYVDTTLADRRSWIRGGNVRFQRSASGPYDFTVYLATPATTDQLCAPLNTNGYTSCRQGDDVVVNLARWMSGVEHWDGSLDSYRRYVINHEVGHRLGHGHERCPRQGGPAPVMQQQTLTLAGCTGNAWPYLDGELHRGPAGSY